MASLRPHSSTVYNRPPARTSVHTWWIGRVKRALTIIAVAGGVWYGIHTLLGPDGANIRADLANKMATRGYVLKTIRFEGLRHLQQPDLAVPAGLVAGTPTFAVSLNDARMKMMENPWVDDVSLTRVWPDTITVRVAERTPVAIWADDEHANAPALIDKAGHVLTREGLSAFGPFLLVVGAGANTHAQDIIEALKTYPDLAVRVSQAMRISDRRWDLQLQEGVRIRLPDDKELARGFEALRQMNKTENILNGTPCIVDLRLPDKPAVIRPQKPAQPTL